MARQVQVVFDCHDPAAMAAFWAEALGYKLDPPPAGFATWQDWLRDRGVPSEEWNSASGVSDPAGLGPRVFFQRVPEGKVVKNRVHLDINVGGGRAVPLEERRQRIDAEAKRLITLGVKIFRAFEQQGEYWVTMLDPEGDEFDLQ